jgi:hypothetical protein
MKNPDQCIEQLWSLESMGVHDDPSKSCDDDAIEQYQKSVKKVKGRYSVSWPLNHNISELPSNYGLALGRLKGQLNRLQARKDLLRKYNDIFAEQLQNGVIEEVSTGFTTGMIVHYLAHHPVETPAKSTTKVRVVFDASARSGKENLSLNDCLLRGPVNLEHLVGLLLRFRLHKVAIVADIEKAFHQVGLNELDRDFTRFLWVKDPAAPPTGDNLRVFRFTRVPFGMKSSPFLLDATIGYHLQQYSSGIAQQLNQDKYVDNIVTGADNSSDAKKLYSTGKRMFAEAGMNLREWQCSSAEVMKEIPSQDKANGGEIKVLGIDWQPEPDVLRIPEVTRLQSSEPAATKRSVLSLLAQIFDPLGLVSPVTVRSRILLQEIVKSKADWDDSLSAPYQVRFRQTIQDIKDIPTVQIPRFVAEWPSVNNCSLHCFVDASAVAYSGAVYIRCPIRALERSASVNLIYAKARVNPIKKQLTIPNLELMAAVLGKRLLEFVKEHISFKGKTVMWSDSQCVLSWLESDTKLNTFVANRVKEVRKLRDCEFRYVNTEDNPADIGSRGASVAELGKLWWEGPPWLKLPNTEWPRWVSAKTSGHEKSSSGKEPEKVEKNGVIQSAVAAVDNQTPFGIDDSQFSDLNRLMSTSAWCFRFIKLLKSQSYPP